MAADQHRIAIGIFGSMRCSVYHVEEKEVHQISKETMNKKYILPAVLALLILCSAMLYWWKGKPEDLGMDVSDRRFRIENTEDVGSFSIERKNYPKIIFTKKKDGWYLNSGRKARDEAPAYILNTMKALTLKYIPNRAGTEVIKKSIAKTGIKVQFFDKEDELMKSFFIGNEIGDGSGTAFLMEGAEQPYVLFTQGASYSIRTRFLFGMNEYETKDIFVEKAGDIEMVEIKYPYDKPSSFTLKKKLLGWEITNPYTGTKLPKLNEKLIEPYLGGFSNIVAEYNDSNNPHREMILRQPIFCEITVLKKDGTKKHITAWSLANIEFKQNKYSPKEVGEDTRFEVLTDGNEFMLIQHRVIGKIMLAFDSFALR